MEKKLTGIVISTTDYKEKDKIITLLTAEQGLVKVIAKGVKNLNAKLKYAKELFTFGYYDVVSKGGLFYVLVSCDVIENFDNIKSDPQKYIEVSNITNIIKDIAQYNDLNTSLLLEYIDAIKALNYEKMQYNIVLTKFLTKIFEALGYKLNQDLCTICKGDLSQERYLNIETGEIICSNCKTALSDKLTNLQYLNLKIITKKRYQELSNINLKNLNELLKILTKNYCFKVSHKFKFYL